MQRRSYQGCREFFGRLERRVCVEIDLASAAAEAAAEGEEEDDQCDEGEGVEVRDAQPDARVEEEEEDEAQHDRNDCGQDAARARECSDELTAKEAEQRHESGDDEREHPGEQQQLRAKYGDAKQQSHISGAERQVLHVHGRMRRRKDHGCGHQHESQGFDSSKSGDRGERSAAAHEVGANPRENQRDGGHSRPQYVGSLEQVWHQPQHLDQEDPDERGRSTHAGMGGQVRAPEHGNETMPQEPPLRCRRCRPEELHDGES